jgi:hypothetical protein
MEQQQRQKGYRLSAFEQIVASSVGGSITALFSTFLYRPPPPLPPPLPPPPLILPFFFLFTNVIWEMFVCVCVCTATPLDVVKTRLQAQSTLPPSPTTSNKISTAGAILKKETYLKGTVVRQIRIS